MEVNDRVTATDEQGRVYRSQDFTFTTAAETGGEGAGTGDQPGEENVASLAARAQVVGVSSNYGGADDSSWGANNAIDGQPNTAWSSNGDGDDAWIEIGLTQTYDMSTIGFWTRRMCDGTAQIFRFTVSTDQGETLGFFDLPGADRMHTFPVQFVAGRLRFDAVETSSGNTGAVEIEAYGTPHGP